MCHQILVSFGSNCNIFSNFKVEQSIYSKTKISAPVKKEKIHLQMIDYKVATDWLKVIIVLSTILVVVC